MNQVAIAVALTVGLAGASTPAFAQSSAQANRQQPSASAGTQELYHVHFAKAAPGKLREMIDGYLSAPADPNASAPPLVLRHVEGDDWDLLVLTPLGKEDKLTAAVPSAADQQFIQRMRPLRALHSDTFAIGPAWTEARTELNVSTSNSAVVPTSGSSAAADKPVYIVTTYRALPGHRDQLEEVLRKMAALNPGSRVTLQHMEGSPWDLVSVDRFNSWTAFADNEANPDMQKLRAQGFTSADGPSLALREHMAEHHDTIAVKVDGGSK
jgi:hypothetical protein